MSVDIKDGSDTMLPRLHDNTSARNRGAHRRYSANGPLAMPPSSRQAVSVGNARSFAPHGSEGAQPTTIRPPRTGTRLDEPYGPHTWPGGWR